VEIYLDVDLETGYSLYYLIKDFTAKFSMLVLRKIFLLISFYYKFMISTPDLHLRY